MGIGKFEKVSFEQFKKDWLDTYNSIYQITDSDIWQRYEMIQLPTRSTKGSAGYDFHTPIDISLAPGETIKFPTGIRAAITDPNIVLLIVPRSSIGFKYAVRLNNTVGVIDADYQNSDNEGHIFIKLQNNGDKIFHANAGDRIAQGIFVQYFVTNDDDADGNRTGGIGSTGK